MYDAVVIGGGQAGLAGGYELKKAGLNFVILEASPEPTGSWPAYYESLELFSPAKHSSLEGMPFPGDPEHYPTRNEVIEYLKAYAQAFALPMVTNTRIVKVETPKGSFRLTAEDGTLYHSRTVICATGPFSNPYLPQLEGHSHFKGQILHSSAYLQPQPFAGKRVVVVGAGNSAVQIAVELAGVAHTNLAVRSKVRFAPQRILGKDLHDWLKLIDRLPLGKWFKVGSTSLVFDTGRYRAALEQGKPDQRAMFQRFSEDGVVWADGSEEQVDTVIFATGFRPSLEYLSGTTALRQGQPLQRQGISTAVPGLYFVGLSGQRSIASASLRGVGTDARFVVSHLERYLKATPRSALCVRLKLCPLPKPT